MLPLQHAQRFQVFQRGEFALAVGDAILITQNGRDDAGTRLNNGASYRVHDVPRIAGAHGGSGVHRTGSGELQRGKPRTVLRVGEARTEIRPGLHR